MSQEARADELIAKAQKRLSSWSLFGGNKHEEACEMFVKAANLYKVSKQWDQAGDAFEKAAGCHLKLDSAHEAATTYTDAANCYKKTNAEQALLLYKEAIALQIDLGRFTTAAKLQKEVAELYDSENQPEKAMEAFQTAADYYIGEESTSQANQCLLKVAGFATLTLNFKRAVEIYEQVAMSSLDNSLLKFSVKDYLLCAGMCQLALGNIDNALQALERYKSWDVTFASTREGSFLDAIARAYEALDEDDFTDKVREFDEISRLNAQKVSILIEVKKHLKASQDDIT